MNSVGAAGCMSQRMSMVPIRPLEIGLGFWQASAHGVEVDEFDLVPIGILDKGDHG